VILLLLLLAPQAGDRPAGGERAPAGIPATNPQAKRDLQARDLLLTAPFSVARNSFFYAALEVPPLDTARILPVGSTYARLDSTHTESQATRRVFGKVNHFDGLFHQWFALDVSRGILPGFEAGARFTLAGWDESKDRFFLFDRKRRPLVRFEDTVIHGTGPSQRHFNLSTVVLHGKGTLSEGSAGDLALAVSAKLPVGRPHDLINAGTYDLNFTFLGTREIGRFTLHANLGVGIPLGSQNLFILQDDISLHPFAHGGVALNARVKKDLSVGIQVEANSSAFGEVPFLDGTPVTTTLGVRKISGDWIFEGGGGVGLTNRASSDYTVFISVGRLF